MSQLESYKKEKDMLEQQLANRSEEKLQKLETEIVTLRGKIKEVEEENKSLQKLQNEQGKFLEMLHSGTDFQNKLKVLNEELRV
jgi:3-methyladenine DNA glycosylase Tag